MTHPATTDALPLNEDELAMYRDSLCSEMAMRCVHTITCASAKRLLATIAERDRTITRLQAIEARAKDMRDDYLALDSGDCPAGVRVEGIRCCSEILGEWVTA